MNYLVIFLLCAAILSALYSIRFHTPFFKWIFFLTIVDLVSESVAFYLKVHHHHNIFPYNIFMLIEGVVLPFAGTLLITHILAKRLIYTFTVLFILIWILYMVTTDVSLFKTIPSIFSSFIILTEYIYILIMQAWQNEKNLWRDSLFWLPLSMVVYFGGIIPYFGMIDYLNHLDQKMSYDLFYINYILITLRYTFVIIAFILLRPQHIKNHHASH